jgi:DNA uptake protein ComE-like DNA-binding protein
VDINTATKAELRNLPGITDAYAAKIIADRPYRTKAHLLTHKILPGALYEAIRKRIVAEQPVSAPVATK